jgi:hypothetical protein
VRPSGELVFLKRFAATLSEEGTYARRFRDVQPGKRYRFVARFPGDADHVSAPAAPLSVQIDP